MMSPRAGMAVVCFAFAALLAGGGCVATPSTVNEALAAGEPEPLDVPFPPGDLLVAPGTADLEDIHLPSVMVSASILTEKGPMMRKSCSGVIVHPRLVV